MKSKLILLLLCLFSFISFSQKITYKDIKGKWELQNSSQIYMSFNFIDAKNVIAVTSVKKLNYDHSTDTTHLTYILDTSSNTTKLITTKIGKNHNANSDTLFIKIVKWNVLEFQKNILSDNWNDNGMTLSYSKVDDIKN